MPISLICPSWDSNQSKGGILVVEDELDQVERAVVGSFERHGWRTVDSVPKHREYPDQG